MLWMRMDISDKVRTQLGVPTILINNAGIVRGKRLLDLSAADVERFAPTAWMSVFDN
jgi:NAD(P)-dependent dehydrogenase (short-subunit alcohol dehydrogenase family)